MIIPPFGGAIGLSQLLSKYGSLNLLLMKVGLMNPAQPVDWLANGGFWGIIILQVLALYPIMYLNVAAAMANIDPSLREAAQNLGASGWRLFRTVTLPLIFGFSKVVPVQIFDSFNEINTNPMGLSPCRSCPRPRTRVVPHKQEGAGRTTPRNDHARPHNGN